jgi:hypothetical protein
MSASTRLLAAALALACLAVADDRTAEAQPSGPVSTRKPTGMILSTGNIYFTSREGGTAHVWRTAQSAQPGQEVSLYSQADARFGDIVFANVGGGWFGYFFSQKDNIGPNESIITIKRVPLTGGAAIDLPMNGRINNVDIFNSHRNLVTDGAYLYWQDIAGIQRMRIAGGDITTLETTQSHTTPTAGIALRGRNLIYADMDRIRYVPTAGPITSPLVRTIAETSSQVVTIHVAPDRVYWGERSGAVRVKRGSLISTLAPPSNTSPTSISAHPVVPVDTQVWTRCAGGTCELRIERQSGNWTEPIGASAFGATVTSTRRIFWADQQGLHRRAF